jgi:hypothetical protein
MGKSHTHHDHNLAHDPEAERRALVAATSVVGPLLGAHLVVGALGAGYERPWGIPPALVAASIGGGRAGGVRGPGGPLRGQDRRRYRAAGTGPSMIGTGPSITPGQEQQGATDPLITQSDGRWSARVNRS